MPVFEFYCKKCNKSYETLTTFDETGKYSSVKCEYCGSKRKKIIISAPNFAFSNPVGTTLWNSDTHGHDYRFKHNLPNVLEQRKNAEIMSHMGADPYGGGTEGIDFDMGEGVHDAESRPGLS